MDDSCAVCAEPLQWVAYGPCGHREVCSNCVVRLRFICEDRRCCLCKSESEIVFITKALGDFTRMINDFAVFPADPREGQVGTYWYHEGTQAYFDDVDHYKIIKAMCRLSCSACDKRNEWSGGSKGKGNFRNVELLKSHLAQRHRLSMCSLCLEGRKVFICEQKLYTKAQLDQHIKTGDSEVDGSETERGGFMGHPICQFCEKPYYGEHELYSHMQTEHYTCHICQRQHPGKYEYYKNYDDLEIHFRQAHFLCEDEGCLEKKFVVFTSESEMKRHNALEHGGRMSRAKRSAALQIPISFQYRQFSQQDRRGRGRRFNSDSTGNQLSEEVHDTPVTSDPPSSRATSSNARAIFSHRESGAFESVGSFELLTDLEGESSSVDTHAIRPNSRTALLEESSFPPLPAAPSKGKKKNKNVLGGLGRNSTASRLHPQNNSQAWSTANGSPNSFIQSFPQLRPVSNSGLLSSSSSSSLLQNRSTTRNSHSSSSSSSRTISIGQAKPHEPSSSTTDSSSRKLPTNGTIAHPSSAPNLLGRESFVDPVSATRTAKAATRSQISQKAEDVNAANMSLVERIRLALEFDENRYAAFNKISSQYRHGVINTEEYLANVCQFGLSHLVLELARLCPDPDKQRELVETYKFNTRNSVLSENDSNNRSARSKNKRSSKKGKEKCEESGISTSEEVSIDSIISSMKNLGSNHKNLLDRMDGLSKHADQSAKGKSKILTEDNWTNIDSAHDLRIEPLSQNGSQSTEQNSSNKTSGTVGGGNKPRKKTTKYLRNRLGNDAASSRSELGGSELNEEKIEEEKDPPEGLPVSGVWRNGGGRKLAAMTQKNRI